MRPCQRLLIAALVAIATAFPLTATHRAAAATDTDNAPAAVAIDLVNDECGLIDAINFARASSGLPALSVDDRLTDVARYRSQDMASHQYFSHVTPDGRSIFDVLDADAIPWTTAGENLAKSKGLDPVTAAIDGFMNSPAHRDNVLESAYSHVGIGAALGTDGTILLAVIFTN